MRNQRLADPVSRTAHHPPESPRIVGFDVRAMYAAMDAARAARGLTWRQVAAELWDQSRELNAQRRDHPIAPSTLTGIAARGDCTCQHALFILRWLGRTPESFLRIPPPPADHQRLPAVGPHQRLRWDLEALFAALDARRRDRGLTWPALAEQVRCTDHQLRGLRTAKFAIGMRLAMRIVQWLEQPAATFIDAVQW